jgi:hypothetical protein
MTGTDSAAISESAPPRKIARGSAPVFPTISVDPLKPTEWPLKRNWWRGCKATNEKPARDDMTTQEQRLFLSRFADPTGHYVTANYVKKYEAELDRIKRIEEGLTAGAEKLRRHCHCEAHHERSKQKFPPVYIGSVGVSYECFLEDRHMARINYDDPTLADHLVFLERSNEGRIGSVIYRKHVTEQVVKRANIDSHTAKMARNYLKRLPRLQFEILAALYWGNQAIHQVAEKTRLSEDEVKEARDSGLKRIGDLMRRK